MRRLRAKLGPEHEALIGTVRNVGYRFVPAKGGDEGRVPRAVRPADQDPANGDVSEADSLAAGNQQEQKDTEHEEAHAAPADRR